MAGGRSKPTPRIEPPKGFTLVSDTFDTDTEVQVDEDGDLHLVQSGESHVALSVADLKLLIATMEKK